MTGDEGRWEFTQLGSKAALLSVDAEIRQIEGQVRREQDIRQRLVDINGALGVKKNATKK